MLIKLRRVLYIAKKLGEFRPQTNFVTVHHFVLFFIYLLWRSCDLGRGSALITILQGLVNSEMDYYSRALVAFASSWYLIDNCLLPRPTQPGHPSVGRRNECRQWSRPLLWRRNGEFCVTADPGPGLMAN